MNNFLKKNWYKVNLIALWILTVSIFCYGLYSYYLSPAGKELQVKTAVSEEINTNNIPRFSDKLEEQETTIHNGIIELQQKEGLEEEHGVYHTKEELCRSLSPQNPLPNELKFKTQIKRDPFIKHLRKVLDAFLNGKTISCQGSSCYSNDIAYYIESSEIDAEYLKGQFIVLQTDIAPGGGESIIILFKDKPDQVFYVWVYGGKIGEDYDVRGFNEFGKLSNKRLSDSDIQDAQKTFVNQICSDKFGF
ncbi:MAG: hypothetical protein NTU76_01295 [Candidatus Taylorbacteria bacterium]|nr:hypothetical protein [Candidatus Taylorbacteria bacterium]